MVTNTEALFQRWHVTENDVTDGWAVVNVRTEKLSAVWGYGNVHVFLETQEQEIAEYVAKMHNHRLGLM